MKPRTKRRLNVLFALGLITAALSIGRAVTLTRKTLEIDATCELEIDVFCFLIDDLAGNMVPNYYIGVLEGRLGIIFACGPAIRQFWAYRKRMHSFLPSRGRQHPNEDFEKMRYRINLRDIFWYNKAPMINGKVLEAARIFQTKRSPPPTDGSADDLQDSQKMGRSAMDLFEQRLKKVLCVSRGKEVMTLLPQQQLSS